MTLIERIRGIFAATPTIEHLTDAVATLELALAEARSTAAEARQAHTARALEFATADDQTAAKRSRAKVDDAERHAQDLATALDDAKARLQAAQSAQTAAGEALGWAKARALLVARSERVLRLQLLLDQVASEHGALLVETEAAWEALPVKPWSRPPTFKEPDLEARVQLYLFGASDGRLGQGANAHVARMKPPLVQTADEAAAMLLSAYVPTPAAPTVAMT